MELKLRLSFFCLFASPFFLTEARLRLEIPHHRRIASKLVRRHSICNKLQLIFYYTTWSTSRLFRHLLIRTSLRGHRACIRFHSMISWVGQVIGQDEYDEYAVAPVSTVYA
ncbi:hypothetical protein F5Y02DRAFT_67722 [Annulohypoxylon stygium]|nr:hypothetical protein F5Y02DRAFT_67722 [Annulohypoxylon stygium]